MKIVEEKTKKDFLDIKFFFFVQNIAMKKT
jgi:hypothetical protein